ncbi:MAG: cyclic nucleotide-binding domain-containing protein [Candidatus Edwardsbacteria bacterium]|jgi:CRP-like cAMP-binding protein|nr:cyclic nucleotide-binding domain-containing protein [Candidatus Edwardsbacteria bacterium]
MAATARTTDLLKQVYLFNDLTQPELERIMAIAYEKTFAKEQPVFQEGEIGDAFYIVTEGQVRISTMVPGVGEEALKVLRPGDYFGEMALIDDFPRSAAAIAHEGDIRLLAVYKRDFRKLMADDAAMANKLMSVFIKTLSTRLRETNEKLKNIFAIAKAF